MSPTIQTQHNTTNRSLSLVDHNVLTNTHDHLPTSGQHQPSPQELLSSSSHVSNTYQFPLSPFIPLVIFQSPIIFATPIGQHHVTTSQNCEAMSESISLLFHTQITNALFLVHDHHMLTRVKTRKSKPKAFIVYTEPTTTTTNQALAHPE